MNCSGDADWDWVGGNSITEMVYYEERGKRTVEERVERMAEEVCAGTRQKGVCGH